MEQKYLVALETGSSKIRGAIGVVDASGILTVKAVEEERLTDGVRYGCVRNVAEVAQAMNNILDRLQQREPTRAITGVYASLGGKSTMLSTCRIDRRLPLETEITDEHVRQVMEEARATVLNDREIVAVTPRGFVIDGDRTQNPVGTFGRNIEATYNLVSCRTQLKSTLTYVLGKTDTEVHGLVVRQIALADLVLTRDEKRLGVMLVDFGAETVTVSFYKDGVLVYLATLPMGSRNITRDITALNYLEERAEQFKKVGGNAMVSPGASAIVDGMDYTEINNYVSARAGEIIANINNQIELAGLKKEKLGAGIVIVGSGALLKGFQERLHDTTKLNVRAGISVGDVRIADPRINVTEAIDVISVLRSVAPDAQECTELETVEYYDPEPAAPDATASTPDNNKEDDDDPFEEDEEFDRKSRRSGWGFFQKVRESIAGALNENDDDDLG